MDYLTTLQNERWLPVVGHEGRYEVSNLGNVRALFKTGLGTHSPAAEPRSVRPWEGRGGYWFVTFWRDNHKKNVQVQSVVLEAFIGPRPEGAQHRCHADDDKANNRLSNLRWDTAKANHADAVRNDRIPPARSGVRHWNARLNEDDVRCIRAEPAFPGVNQMLASAFDVPWQHIWQVRARRCWKHVMP